MDNEQINEKKWDAQSDNYDHKRWTKFFRSQQKYLIDLLQLQPDQTFLDIGCGTGWAVYYAASQITSGNVYGLDLSGEMIEKAKITTSEFTNVQFLKSSAENIPLEDKSVDYAICTNSFHHYKKPLTVLREIFRVLKPSGKIYILDLSSDEFFGKIINKFNKITDSGHVNLYSSADFKELFTDSGLNHVEDFETGKIGPFHWKVHIGAPV